MKKHGIDRHLFYSFCSGSIVRTSRAKDILWIENKRWEVVQRIKKFWDNHIKPWSDELFRIKGFCAIKTNDEEFCGEGEDSDEYPVVFHTSSKPYKSYHTEYAYERIKRIKYCPFDRLPLFMGDNLSSDEKFVLERRLKGEIPEPVYRQDLYEKYLWNEKRLARLRKLEAICFQIMNDIINQKYHKLWEQPREVLLKITINGREYWYNFNRGFKIIQRPEDDFIEEEIKS